MRFLLAVSLALQLFHHGMDLYYQGKYREAAAMFTRAIQQDPNLLKAYRARAKAEEKLGLLDRALEDLNYFLSKNPKDQDALYLRMRVYIKKKDYEKALKDAELLLSISPQEPTYIYSKALILESTGRLGEASRLFEKASQLFLDEKYKELSAFKAKVDRSAELLKQKEKALEALAELDELLQGKYPLHLAPAMPMVARLFFYSDGMTWFMAKNLLVAYARRVPQDRAWVWNLVLKEFNLWSQGKKKKEIKKMERELSSLRALMGVK